MPIRIAHKNFVPKGAPVVGGLGWITFVASVDHGSVASYIVRIYDQTSGTLAASLDIGKPAPDSNNEIQWDLTSILNTLGGNFIARVAARGAGGTNESTDSNAFACPIS